MLALAAVIARVAADRMELYASQAVGLALSVLSVVWLRVHRASLRRVIESDGVASWRIVCAVAATLACVLVVYLADFFSGARGVYAVYCASMVATAWTMTGVCTCACLLALDAVRRVHECAAACDAALSARGGTSPCAPVDVRSLSAARRSGDVEAAACATYGSPGAMRDGVCGTLREVFALRALSQKLASLLLARLITTLIMFIGFTFNAQYFSLLIVLEWLWLVPLVSWLTVCATAVSGALLRLYTTVMDPTARPAWADDSSYARVGLTTYLHGLQAQDSLSYKVFGVSVTHSNVLRLLVSIGTVSLGVLSWGTRISAGSAS